MWRTANTRFRGADRQGIERRWGLSAMLPAVFLVGCVTAQIEQVRTTHTSTSIADHESVVILARRHHRGFQAEESFMKCVRRVVAGAERPISIYPNDQFRDQLFPWFEPRTAPLNAEALPELLANRAIIQRIEDSGVRYLIWIDGDTEQIDQGGAITCAIGPAGGGCLGFGWWEKDSTYEASIWDLKQAEIVGKISSEATGTSYLPAIIIPIPIIAPTQSTACKGLGRQLAEFLAVEEG